MTPQDAGEFSILGVQRQVPHGPSLLECLAPLTSTSVKCPHCPCGLQLVDRSPLQLFHFLTTRRFDFIPSWVVGSGQSALELSQKSILTGFWGWENEMHLFLHSRNGIDSNTPAPIRRIMLLKTSNYLRPKPCPTTLAQSIPAKYRVCLQQGVMGSSSCGYTHHILATHY